MSLELPRLPPGGGQSETRKPTGRDKKANSDGVSNPGSGRPPARPSGSSGDVTVSSVFQSVWPVLLLL